MLFTTHAGHNTRKFWFQSLETVPVVLIRSCKLKQNRTICLPKTARGEAKPPGSANLGIDRLGIGKLMVVNNTRTKTSDNLVTVVVTFAQVRQVLLQRRHPVGRSILGIRAASSSALFSHRSLKLQPTLYCYLAILHRGHMVRRDLA